MANLKDYGTSTIVSAPSPASSGTSLTVVTTHGSRFPTPPFFVTAHPDGQLPTLDNSEKIEVTAVSGDTFTIVRAQGETTAKAIADGWRISNTLFADDIGGAALVVDEKDNLLATTPPAPTVGYATDSEDYYIFDGTYWNVGAIRLSRDLPVPDIGYEKSSGKRGYGAGYITDKYLANMTLGNSGVEQNGSIRVDSTKTPNTFEIYLRGQWNTIMYDFTMANGDLRHTPLTEQMYVWRGDSVRVGLNGQPMVQEYKVSMGAFPVYKTINGGTF